METLVAGLIVVVFALLVRRLLSRTSTPRRTPSSNDSKDDRNRMAQFREVANDFPIDSEAGRWSLRKKDFGHGFAFVLVDPEGEERDLKHPFRWGIGFRSTEIVGEKYYVEDLHSPAFMPGREVRLQREADNPHDDEAVSVRSLEGDLKAGYLPRASRTRPRVHKLIEAGTPPRAFVQWRSVTPDGSVARLRILVTLPGTTFREVDLNPPDIE